MTIRILELAKRDLIRGFHFYENQSKGIGNYFLDSLLIYSGIHPIKFGKYHCLLSNRFPFAIYYIVEKEVVYVDAILD
jgi:hypothetical protein